MTPISKAVPEDFAHAYGELVELVSQILRAEVPKGPKEVSQEVLGEKVDEWKHGDCRGAVTLAEAAIKALQYELASRGFREGAEVVSEDLVALGRIESVLEPTPLTGDEAAQIVEVTLPEQLRNARPKARGFRMGELQIIFELFEGPLTGTSLFPTRAAILPTRSCRGLHAPPEGRRRTCGCGYPNRRKHRGCTATPCICTSCRQRSCSDEVARMRLVG